MRGGGDAADGIGDAGLARTRCWFRRARASRTAELEGRADVLHEMYGDAGGRRCVTLWRLLRKKRRARTRAGRLASGRCGGCSVDEHGVLVSTAACIGQAHDGARESLRTLRQMRERDSAYRVRLLSTLWSSHGEARETSWWRFQHLRGRDSAYRVSLLSTLRRRSARTRARAGRLASGRCGGCSVDEHGVLVSTAACIGQAHDGARESLRTLRQMRERDSAYRVSLLSPLRRRSARSGDGERR